LSLRDSFLDGIEILIEKETVLNGYKNESDNPKKGIRLTALFQ
jgi:hypothetical protein